jgi:hypothetical protein
MFYIVSLLLFTIFSILTYIKFIKSKKQTSPVILCKKYRASPTNEIKRGLVVFKGCHGDDDVSFDVVMTPIKFCSKEIVKFENIEIEDLGEC